MSSSNTAAFLSGRGLAWANSSLVAAARVKIGTRPSNHADLLGVFVPGLQPQASSIATAALARPNHRYQNNLASSNALARRRHLRFHSTETQSRTNRPSSANSLPPNSSKHSSPQASYDGQQAGKPPAPPAASTSANDAQPVAADTAAELGSSANQIPTSQSLLAAEKEAKEIEQHKPKQPLMTRVWSKVKEEAAHYWHGSKLLAKEVRISSRLVRRIMLGYSLTRRERRQLKRTMADLLRLIPFIPFIIIPAGELLLPVAIKIFPNMLPSTFESKFAVEEKRRGLIKVRLEMAKFLQETIREGGLQATDKVKTSEEFKEFFRKVRSTGESPDEKDILKVAKLFEDDLTLDNLSRPQLVSVCRYMQINAFGTDNYLRYQIRHKLNRIRQDDIAIKTEGVESMSLHELVSACQNRGIRTSNLSEERLRQELGQWINLHIKERISGILLILSKAFNYVGAEAHDDGKSHIKSLELTLSSLPDNLLSEAELNVNKEGATNKQRLEVLEQQEELIEDEAEQEQEEAAAREAEKERRNAEKARLAAQEESKEPSEKEQPRAEEDARMTNEQLMELGEALSLLSAKSSVLREREELAQLIKEVNAPQPQAQAAAASAASAQSEDGASSEEAAAAAAAAAAASSSTHTGLSKRIKSMLGKIDAQLEEYDRDVGSRMHIIEASPTGKISVDDLEQALRLIKHKPDDEVLEKLVDKLDVDHDGLVPLDDVLDLARAESGLGILRDDTVKDIKAQGREIRGTAAAKPKRSDIVEE